MEFPSYYLRRPLLPTDPATIGQFEALYAQMTDAEGIVDLTAALPSPRWPFLAYLAENKPVLFHGSGNPDITELVPRQSNDIYEFGNRCAVYAASDGIWPIFFAILDRGRMALSLLNSCFRGVSETGEFGDPHYFFSINQDALEQNPWRSGTIYILPRASFESQKPSQKRGVTVQIMEWASLSAVTPLAKITVGPDDFPFLDHIRGHDVPTLIQRAEAHPEGFPWLEAAEDAPAKDGA